MRYLLLLALIVLESEVNAFTLSPPFRVKTSRQLARQDGRQHAMSLVTDRRETLKYLFASGVTIISIGSPDSALAQRPPPRPNIKSIPQECLQAGACAMAGTDMGLPKFKTSDQAPEVLDPKSGQYSTGLKVQDVSVGDVNGTPVSAGKTVSIQYVLRRANGYFVDASYGFDRFETYDFKFGTGQVVAGFEQAVAGMHAGGRRRFVVPPELGYTAGVGDGKPGPIPPGWGERRALDSHRREPLVFEVQVVKVR